MISDTNIGMLNFMYTEFNMETRVEAHTTGNIYIAIKRPQRKPLRRL